MSTFLRRCAEEKAERLQLRSSTRLMSDTSFPSLTFLRFLQESHRKPKFSSFADFLLGRPRQPTWQDWVEWLARQRQRGL